jgi:protein O-mannosyl-transferase
MTCSAIIFRRLIVLVPLFFVFFSVADFEFLNLDDGVHISNNPHLSPPTLSGLKTLWKEPYRRLYIPLTYTIWSITARLSGHASQSGWVFTPRAFHCLNLFIHTLTCVLLVYPLLELALRVPSAAIFGTVWFAIHPLQVEPVAWISGLKDVLCGFFSLLSVRLFVLLLQDPERFRFRAYLFRAGVLLTLAAALLTKPAAVVVPLLAALFGILVTHRKAREVFSELVPSFFLVLPFAWITNHAQPLAEFEFRIPNWGDRFWIALDALWFYIQKTIFPFGLTVDYGFVPSRAREYTGSYRIALVALSTVLIYYFARARKTQPRMVAAPLWFTVALLPVLGFRPFVFQTVSTVADRYAYLALFAVALFFGMILAPVMERRRVQLISILFITVLCVLSHQQVAHWRNSYQLFSFALDRNPQSWLAHNNLGVYYEGQGKKTRALEEYSLSVRIRPNSTGFNNMGSLFMADRRYGNAMHAFTEGLALQPGDPLLLNNIGSAWFAMGNYSKAKANFIRALNRDPSLKEPKDNLGAVLTLEMRRSRGDFRAWGQRTDAVVLPVLQGGLVKPGTKSTREMRVIKVRTAPTTP